MTEVNFDYEYPDGLDLKPGSDLHKKLLEALKNRIREGYRTSQAHRDTWRKLDHLQTAYVPTENISMLDLERDPKAPLNVVIPVSRANVDTMVAYSAGVFFGDPTGMYPLDAHSGPEAMVAAAKMDRLLNAQGQWFQHKLAHFTALRDSYLYGLSARMPVWTKRKRRDAALAEVSSILYEMLGKSIKAGIGDVIRYMDEVVYQEGSAIQNIDVYSLIVDPNAKLNQYQNAEYLGYWRRTNSVSMLRDEADPEERLFNCKYIHVLQESGNGRSSTQFLQESGRFTRTGDGDVDSNASGTTSDKTTTEVDVAYLFWNLIPKEWGLSDSNRAERWAFAVAADEIICQAYKIDYDYDGVPMVMDGPQTCGYDMFPVSSLAATYGIHQFIDWKVRMHYWNASRVNNSMFVVDGSRIMADDFRKGGPRQIIRTRGPLYGDRNIDQCIKQLNVADHTGDYPAHVQSMMQFNDYCLGTSAITQGDMSSMPDRPTQWGLQTAQQAALSRLSKDCQVMTEQSYYTLVRMMCHNNVQFLDNDMVVKILGSRYEEQLRKEYGLPPGQDHITVSPFDLNMASFDILVQDRMQKESGLVVMEKMMDRMLQTPEIMVEAFAGIDVRRWFLSMVRRLGFANVHEFQLAGGAPPPVSATTMPDEQVLQQEQAGNLIPAGTPV